MQFGERLRLKRKCQDSRQSCDSYLSSPFNHCCKRPCELRDVKMNREEAIWSQGNGFLEIFRDKDQIAPLTFEEEMSRGESMLYTENDEVQQSAICMTKESSEKSPLSVPQSVQSVASFAHQHVNHGIVQLSIKETELEKQSLISKESPGKSQGCSECSAGKSGHFHHIGHWRLIDSPSGFCQI